MLVLAAVVVPVVLGYTAWATRFFRGKVALDDASYQGLTSRQAQLYVGRPPTGP